MSRSKVVREVRKIKADPVYKSKLISKIINCSMYDGKKDTAMKGIYGALEKISSFVSEKYAAEHEGNTSTPQAMTVWFIEKIINKIALGVEVKSRRVGGSNYQIPVVIQPKRSLSLAIKWLVNGARARKERGMIEKFAAELRDIIMDRGEAMKKRETMHKTAEANKAFAHYGLNG